MIDEGLSAELEPIHGARGRPLFTRAFVLLGLAQFGQNVAISSIYASLSLLIVSYLRLPPSIAGVLIGGIFTISLATRLWLGGAIDRLGTRRFGITGATLSGLGAALFAAAGLGAGAPAPVTTALLVVAAVGLGLGYSMASNSLNTQLAHTAPEDRRAEAVGYYGIFLTVGTGVGSGTCVFLFTTFGPGAPFVAAGLAYVFSAVLWRVLPTTTGATDHEHPPARIGLERYVAVPALAMACVVYAQATATAFIALAGREAGIASPGLYFVTLTAAAFVSRTLIGRLADRRGRFAALVPGALLQSGGLVVVAFAADTVTLAVAGGLIGAGIAMLQVTIQTLVIDLAPPERRGSAMATLGASFDLGVILGAVVAGQIAGALGFDAMFLITSALPIVGVAILLGWRLQRTRTAVAVAPRRPRP